MEQGVEIEVWLKLGDGSGEFARRRLVYRSTRERLDAEAVSAFSGRVRTLLSYAAETGAFPDPEEELSSGSGRNEEEAI